MKITISRCVVTLIQRAAADAAPNEACGLLFGGGGRVDNANLIANVAADPLRQFEIDPSGLFAALRAERAGGPAVIGHWHSHPSGDCRPSKTDAELAIEEGRLWLIVGGGDLLLWLAVSGGALHDRFDPVAFEIR